MLRNQTLFNASMQPSLRSEQYVRDAASKTIWIFWAQGWSNAPRLALNCASSWAYHNPAWNVVRLSLQTLTRYEVRPEDNDYAFVPSATSAHYADLVRMELLRRWGGLWVDASIFCIQSIDNWMTNASNMPAFFAKRWGSNLANNLLYARGPRELIPSMMCVALKIFWRHPHEIKRIDSCYFIWNTLFNCLVRIHPDFHTAYRATPSLLSARSTDMLTSRSTGYGSLLGNISMSSSLKQSVQSLPFVKLSFYHSVPSQPNSIMQYFLDWVPSYESVREG